MTDEDEPDEILPEDRDPIETGLRFGLLSKHEDTVYDLIDDPDDAQPEAVRALGDVIHQMFMGNVYDEGKLPKPYQVMWAHVENEVGAADARRTLHQSLGSRLDSMYVQQEQEELDPDKCQFIKDDGEQCGNDRPEDGDFCPTHSLDPDEMEV